MSENGIKNGNGTVIKIVGGLIALTLAGVGKTLWDRVDGIYATQQVRAERIKALEVTADSNKARLDRLEAVSDKHVDEINNKLQSIDTRLRSIEVTLATKGPKR